MITRSNELAAEGSDSEASSGRGLRGRPFAICPEFENGILLHLCKLAIPLLLMRPGNRFLLAALKLSEELVVKQRNFTEMRKWASKSKTGPSCLWWGMSR